MESNRFDDIIRQKLGDLNTSDSSPRWDLFLEKKKSVELKKADTSFDNSIRKSLSNYTVEYNSAHWVLLKNRLENIYRTRKQLYIIKSLEFLTLMTLLLSISNFYNTFTEFGGVDKNISTTSSMPIAEHNSTDQRLGAIADKGTEQQFEVNATSNQKSLNDLADSSNEIVDNNFSSKLSKYKESTSNLNTIQRTNSVTAFDSNSFLDEVNVLQRKTIEKNTIKNQSSSANKSPLPLTETLSSLAALDQAIQRDASVIDISNGSLGLEQKVIPPNANWLHIVASFDNNRITTPFKEIYNPKGPLQTEMFGYTISALVSFERNKLEFETGIGYSVYNKPMNYQEYWNSDSEAFLYKFTNINYDIVSVPLRTKYHFVKNADWSLFTTAGISPEVIISAGYDEQNDFLGRRPLGSSSSGGRESSLFRSLFDFNEGVLEGGSFADNFILRANLGIGMQRNITPTLSAYFSGDLYLPLLNKDYGPTDDTFSKYAFSFGLKERF